MTQKEALRIGKESKENKIKELYSQGLTPGEIARKLDIAEFIVVRVLGLN